MISVEYLIEEHQRRRKQHLRTLSRVLDFEEIKKQIQTEIETETLRAKYEGMGQRELIDSYLTLHDSRERFVGIFEALCDAPPEIFWPVFMHWWPMCDGTRQNRQHVVRLLKRHHELQRARPFMSAEDGQFFDSLSYPLTVHRGCGKSYVRSVTWTTDRDRAEFFARGGRFPTPRNPVVATAIIDESAVFFATNCRNEAEVVLDPYKIRNLSLAPPATLM